MESAFRIPKKTNAVICEWANTIRDLRTAAARIQEIQARSPGEYVVVSQHTQSLQTCGGGNGSGIPSGIAGRRAVYFHFPLPG
jgi:hypothetical protein